MKSVRLLAILIISVLLFGCSTVDSNHTTGSSATKETSDKPNTTSDNKVKFGQEIKFSHDYVLKSEPSSSTSENTISLIENGKKYEISSQSGIYIKIVLNDKSGWIPEWYAINDNSISDANGEEFRLIDKETALYLVPEVSNQYTDPLTIKKGQVVKIKREYNDWYDVEFVQYEAMNPGERWIKKDSTIQFSDEKCMEGIVKVSSLIYDNDFLVRKGDSFDNNPVRVVKKLEKPSTTEIYYEVSGASGFDGLIKESDFVPNPLATH